MARAGEKEEKKLLWGSQQDRNGICPVELQIKLEILSLVWLSKSIITWQELGRKKRRICFGHFKQARMVFVLLNCRSNWKYSLLTG